LVEDARRAALEGRWDEAIELNRQLVERSPRDADAHNRLGRAFLVLKRYGEATDAYSTALRADPANLIARRNLQRLETLRHRAAPESPVAAEGESDGTETTTPRPTVFIEEVGKTWVDEIVNPTTAEVLAEIFPATQLQLLVEDDRLIVTDNDGRRLGEIEAKTAERVISLLNGGNRYEVYALGLSGQSLRVILREVFRDPTQANTVSFPRQITSRAYMRERDLLRQRDEADFFLLDEEEDEEEDERVAADSDEEESTEGEAEPFIEDTVTVVEEEEERSI
jgi:tetratricopeptide (TPR) repeat protein